MKNLGAWDGEDGQKTAYPCRSPFFGAKRDEGAAGSSRVAQAEGGRRSRDRATCARAPDTGISHLIVHTRDRLLYNGHVLWEEGACQLSVLWSFAC
jgi:hypothetical protein